MSEAFALAALAAVTGGIGLAFRELLKDRNWYRDRLFRSLDTTEEAIEVAKKKAPGA